LTRVEEAGKLQNIRKATRSKAKSSGKKQKQRETKRAHTNGGDDMQRSSPRQTH